MLYVVHVRCSGPVGARSSLYRLEAIAPALIRSNSAWLFTARSLNSSMSLLPSVGSRQLSAISFQLSAFSYQLSASCGQSASGLRSTQRGPVEHLPTDES